MIPNLNSTEEAMSFGMSATEEEVKMLRRIRNICEIGFYNLFDNLFETDDSKEAYTIMVELSTQAQLMWEAVETSQFN